MGSAVGAAAGAVRGNLVGSKFRNKIEGYSDEKLQQQYDRFSSMSQRGMLGKVFGARAGALKAELDRRSAALSAQQGADQMQGVNDNITGLTDRVANLEADVKELVGGGGGVGDVAASVAPQAPELPVAQAPVNTGLPSVRPAKMPFSPNNILSMLSVFGSEEQRQKTVKR